MHLTGLLACRAGCITYDAEMVAGAGEPASRSVGGFIMAIGGGGHQSGISRCHFRLAAKGQPPYPLETPIRWTWATPMPVSAIYNFCQPPGYCLPGTRLWDHRTAADTIAAGQAWAVRWYGISVGISFGSNGITGKRYARSCTCRPTSWLPLPNRGG